MAHANLTGERHNLETQNIIHCKNISLLSNSKHKNEKTQGDWATHNCVDIGSVLVGE